jgi:hypothetical protein
METVLIIENFGKFFRKVCCKWPNRVRSAIGSGKVGDRIIVLTVISCGEYCFGTIKETLLLTVAMFCSTVRVF